MLQGSVTWGSPGVPGEPREGEWKEETDLDVSPCSLHTDGGQWARQVTFRGDSEGSGLGVGSYMDTVGPHTYKFLFQVRFSF